MLTRRDLVALLFSYRRVEAEEKTSELLEDYVKRFVEWAKLHDASDYRTLSWPEVTSWQRVKKLWKRFSDRVDREYEEGR